MLSESEIKQALPDDFIKDAEEIRRIRILEEAVKRSEIEDNIINFKIDENLKIGVSTKDGQLYMNNEKVDSDSTLENVFNSPIIPFLKRDYFILLKTVSENLKNCADLS